MAVKKLAIQMDALDSLDFKTDTTIMLALAAQNHMFECYYYLPDNLTYNSGKVYFNGSKVKFLDNPEKFYHIEETSIYDLADFDVVLMRQDPPFNLNYLALTYLLEVAEKKSIVLNNPAGVRAISEKLSALFFKEYIPHTLITKQFSEMKEFLLGENHAVIKPLYGYGGKDIVKIDYATKNLEEVFNNYMNKYEEPIIVQKYLEKVKEDGDKRVIYFDGKVVSTIGRMPKEDDIRANIAQGGLPVATELTAKEMEICEHVGQILQEHDVMFAGVDLIDEHLIEINVTCPTGLRAVQMLYNVDLADEFWKQVIQKYNL